MTDDAALLRRYAEHGSEDAFAELVQRHAALVYGAALRRTNGDEHRAADVAQQVFTKLAREAKKLTAHPVLSAWLHTATRNAALNLMISEQRRKAREQVAMVEAGITDDATPDWEQVRPLLDGAIDELSDPDRAAVVLRFLEKRSFAEIGAALRVTEDAARMRTERALAKLRALLARRGVTSTATALGLVVMAQPVVAVPSALALSLATESLAAASVGFFATLMTTKIITTLVLSALVAFGAGNYVGSKQAAPSVSSPMVAETTNAADTTLQAANQRLAEEVDALRADVARLEVEKATLAESKPVAPTGQVTRSPNIGGQRYQLQQGIMNNLRQINAARVQYEKTYGHAAASIEELVGTDSTHYIKTVRTVGGESYYDLSMMPGQPLTVVTPDGLSVTFDPNGTMTTKIEVPAEVLRMQELAEKVKPAALKALEAYKQAHTGENPPNEEALLPYFATPEEGADFVEFQEARNAAMKFM